MTQAEKSLYLECCDLHVIAVSRSYGSLRVPSNTTEFDSTEGKSPRRADDFVSGMNANRMATAEARHQPHLAGMGGTATSAFYNVQESSFMTKSRFTWLVVASPGR
jgi:hypothetical protein